MLARYQALVVARPDDDGAVRRLLERASAEPGGVERLVQDLAARRETEGAAIDVALGAIAIARGDEAGARRHLEAALADGTRASAYVLAARAAARWDEAPGPRIVELLTRAVALAPDAVTRAQYQRDLAAAWLDVGRIDEARALYAALSHPQGASSQASSTARTELVRVLAARGLCEEARADFDEAARAVSGDASASVGVALLRAQCEGQLHAYDGARAALEGAWPAALRSGRAAELLDAMVALARESDALPALEAVLATRGPLAALHRGIVLEELGREQEALAVLEDVLRRSPRDAETRQRVVRLLARNGRIGDSLVQQRALVRLFPERLAFTLELAGALRDQGRSDEAVASLDRARSRARRDRTSLFLLVDAYARLGAHERVLATLEDIVRAAPDDPRGLVALANELLESRDPADRERALHLVERVAHGEGVAGRVEAARALANLRVFDRAFELLGQAAREAPDAVEVLEAQADLFARAGRDDDAERALSRRIAIALEAGDPGSEQAAMEAEARLVASWARRGTVPQHRPALEAGHARGEASASRMLADVQRRAGDLDGALATLSALSARRPNDARLVVLLARLHHERGDYEAEVAALRRLVELEPARAGTHLARLVELALATYRDDDAVRFADEASHRIVDDASLFVRLGRLHARRRDIDRAARAYARALEIDRDEHEAAWELAMIERERGDARRAMELELSILERSRDDDLRERAGRALLETARADGSEAALEPRLLALALAHGEAPVFGRLALALYASLTVGARGSGDDAALERWVSRALPVLLSGLRDGEVGTRATARQLLFAHPVPGASEALVALAGDESVEPGARVEALAAALHVVTESELPALRALLGSASETLAILALHGIARVGEASPRAHAQRTAALREARAREGRLAAHAWVLTVLVGPSELREAQRDQHPETAGARTASLPWLAAWHDAALATPSAPPPADVLATLLLRHAASRTRDDASLHPAIELTASGPLPQASLDLLARASLGRDEHARLARRALVSTPQLTLLCAPVLARNELLESWLARAITACPRAPREPSLVSGALVRAAGSLEEAQVPMALEELAAQIDDPAWAALVAPVAGALAARVLPVASTTPNVCRSLVALARGLPGLLPPAVWSELLSRPEEGVRAVAARHAPLPVSTTLLIEVAGTDASWTVRRAALLRLGEDPPEAAVLAQVVRAAAADPTAFVRSAALPLVEALPDGTLCTVLPDLVADPDPVVSGRARALTERRCAR